MRKEKRQPRILIIRLSSIGDVLFCTPVAETLREFYPQGYLAWLVEEKSKEVVEGNPFLDEVIVWQRLRWQKDRSQMGLLRFLGKHLGFFWQLRRKDFDIVLDLQGMSRSALASWLTAARQRIGFQDSIEMAQLAYNGWITAPPSASHVSHRYLLAASYLGATPANPAMTVPFTEQDRLSAFHVLASALGSSNSQPSPTGPPPPFAAFCPAASRPHNHWPADRFAQVADWVSEELSITPVFFGAAQDAAYIESIRSACRRPTVSLAGKTSLKEATALLASSQLIVGADTGLTHMAATFGRPVVALFGPGGVNYEPRGPFHETVRADRDCGPCSTSRHCAENYKCMQDIQPQPVIAAIRRVMVAQRVLRAVERQGKQ